MFAVTACSTDPEKTASVIFRVVDAEGRPISNISGLLLIETTEFIGVDGEIHYSSGEGIVLTGDKGSSATGEKGKLYYTGDADLLSEKSVISLRSTANKSLHTTVPLKPVVTGEVMTLILKGTPLLP